MLGVTGSMGPVTFELALRSVKYYDYTAILD